MFVAAKCTCVVAGPTFAVSTKRQLPNDVHVITGESAYSPHSMEKFYTSSACLRTQATEQNDAML